MGRRQPQFSLGMEWPGRDDTATAGTKQQLCHAVIEPDHPDRTWEDDSQEQAVAGGGKYVVKAKLQVNPSDDSNLPGGVQAGQNKLRICHELRVLHLDIIREPGNHVLTCIDETESGTMLEVDADNFMLQGGNIRCARKTPDTDTDPVPAGQTQGNQNVVGTFDWQLKLVDPVQATDWSGTTDLKAELEVVAVNTDAGNWTKKVPVPTKVLMHKVNRDDAKTGHSCQ